MAFLIRKVIQRDWDGGRSFEYAPAAKELYWENRKAAHVFEDGDEGKAADFICANLKAYPPETDEEVFFEFVPLSPAKAEAQRQYSTRPQFIEGGSSKWKKQ